MQAPTVEAMVAAVPEAVMAAAGWAEVVMAPAVLVAEETEEVRRAVAVEAARTVAEVAGVREVEMEVSAAGRGRRAADCQCGVHGSWTTWLQWSIATSLVHQAAQGPMR